LLGISLTPVVEEIDPTAFDDCYEAAVADLMIARLAGKTITAPKAGKSAKVVNLMKALR